MNKKNGKIIFAAILIAFAVFAVVFGGFFADSLMQKGPEAPEFEFVEPLSGDGTGYYRHCYDELTLDEQKVYSVILQSIYDMPEEIEIPDLGEGDLTAIFRALSRDNPDLFCLGLKCTVVESNGKFYFKPDYSMSYDEYKDRLEQSKKAIESIVSSAKAYTSDYEKELFVHDYIINNCQYYDIAEAPLGNTVYGCLVEGKASCEGYSRSFQYILNKLDIDNRLLTGECAEDGVNYIGHMWNYVIIDGDGYFTDVTWDDPKGEAQTLRHTYFNVDTEDILLEHRIEQTVPFVTENENNYFTRENAYLDVGVGDDFELQVTNAVHKALQRGYKSVELRFTDADVASQAKKTLLDDGIIYNVYKDAGLLQTLEGATVFYSREENMNIICFFF